MALGVMEMADEEMIVQSLPHDLRGVIQRITSFANLLYRRNKDPEDREYIEYILTNSRILSDLVDDIDRFTSIPDSIEAEEVNLNDIVSDAIRSINFTLDVEYGSLGMVAGSYTLLFRVFRNLLSNSAKFGAKRVEITRNQMQVIVKDDGPGVRPAETERIFDIFYRAGPKTTEGAGMGLAICRRIMRRLGGHIWCQPEVDNGAIFIIEFGVFNGEDKSSTDRG